MSASILMACGGAETGPTPTPDAGLAPDPVGDPQTLLPQTLSAETPYWAAALPSGAVIAAFDDRIEVVDTATVSRLEPPTSRIVGAGRWPGGTLLAASDGFFVLHEDGLARSPLSDALSDMRPVGLMEVDRLGVRELWIAGSGGLALWSAGEVRRLTPGDLPVTDCVMTYGAPLGGAPAVWVACQGELYALIGAGDVYQAHPQGAVSDVRSLAVDGSDTLWIVVGDGSVWSRAGDGTYRRHDFASGVRSVAAARGTDDVWFETNDGLWRYDQAQFTSVSSPAVDALLAAAGSGQVLFINSDGLVRGHTDRVVRLAGLPEAALLEAPTTVSVHPLQPELVSDVVATLDGADITVTTGSTPSILLDPEGLEDGTHTLEVTAVYTDGQEVQASLQFSLFAGPPPTWSADVQPLFESRCALCHGMQGSARRLDTSEIWRDQIDPILENLRTGRMPLPPTPTLNAEELGKVEGWVAAGYPEGE